MTHEEAVGKIMQAVHAATAGDNQPLHALASQLVAQEAQAEQEEALAKQDVHKEDSLQSAGMPDAMAPLHGLGWAGTPAAEEPAEEGR